MSEKLLPVYEQKQPGSHNNDEKNGKPGEKTDPLLVIRRRAFWLLINPAGHKLILLDTAGRHKWNSIGRISPASAEQPREQRRNGQAGQVIRQFHLADFQNHQRHNTRHKSSGDVDDVGQSMFIEEGFCGILSGQGERAEKRINRKRRQRGRPAEHLYKAGRRQRVHHGFQGEQVKIPAQPVRRRAEPAERRGAK